MVKICKCKILLELRSMDYYFDEREIEKQIEEVIRDNLPSLMVKTKVVTDA